jgi:hypothetical protein
MFGKRRRSNQQSLSHSNSTHSSRLSFCIK